MGAPKGVLLTTRLYNLFLLNGSIAHCETIITHVLDIWSMVAVHARLGASDLATISDVFV